MELTYENMLAHMKKFWDILPGLTPENKHEMAELHTVDCVTSYPGGQSEADHVSSHHEVYRAYVYLEPPPLGMYIDERKKTVTCLIHELAKHPVTGEPVKAFKNRWTGEMDSEVYALELFEFTLVNDQIKIKSMRIAGLQEWQVYI